MVSVTARVVRTIEAVISPSGYPSNSRSSEKKNRPAVYLAGLSFCLQLFASTSSVKPQQSVV
jgi:hypothetical protein